MKPGRDLDALIAEKVMGWTTSSLLRTAWQMDDHHRVLKDSFSPSTDIAAAWEVVERLKGNVPSIFYDPVSEYWHATFEKKMTVFAETAPHAICLAALKTVGVEVNGS